MKTVKEGFLDRVNSMYDKIKTIHEVDATDDILESRMLFLHQNITKQSDAETVLDMMIESMVMTYIVTKELK